LGDESVWVEARAVEVEKKAEVQWWRRRRPVADFA